MIIDNKEYSEIKANKTLKQPSLNGGYMALYDNRIPVDLKYVDYERNVNQLGRAEYVIFKMFTFGMKANAAKIKIEIQSEYDPFFNLTFECDASKYDYLKTQQGLNSQFQELPTLLIKCLNKIYQNNQDEIKNSKGKLSASLLVGSDGKAKFAINQSSAYKNIQVITLDFAPENEEHTEEKISFKYTELTKKVEQAEERLWKIQQIIKEKNPTLLTQIIKTTKAQNQSFLN